MADQFEIYMWDAGTGSYSWTAPPDDAVPQSNDLNRIEYAPMVQRNGPTARTGTGAPCNTDDELFATVGRSIINQTGQTWWYSTLGMAGQDSMSVTVRLYDPEAQSWSAYTGTMWRPTYTAGFRNNQLVDFRVLISNLEAQ